MQYYIKPLENGANAFTRNENMSGNMANALMAQPALTVTNASKVKNGLS